MTQPTFNVAEPTRYSIKPDEKIDIKPIFRDKNGNILQKLNFPLSWCTDINAIGKLEMSDQDEYTGTFTPYGKAGTARIVIIADTQADDDEAGSFVAGWPANPLAEIEITVTEDLGITTEITAEIYTD